MMDASAEIPQGVSPDTLLHSQSPTQEVSVTKVLDDDNLLREIIVRVGFPTTLVRAALVCKRWLSHASDHKLLNRFRKLHPPRLLGCYVSVESLLLRRLLDGPRFVPMLPQPPELATVMCRLKSYNFGTHRIMNWPNNSVFTTHLREATRTYGVHHPLCAETDMQIFPPLPHVQDRDTTFIQIISEEEDSGMSYMYVVGKASETRVYRLQDGEWIMRTLATCPHGMLLHPISVHFGHNKIYLPSVTSNDIIVLDLMGPSYSTIKLPEGVKYRYFESMLSRPDDASSVYLFNVKEFQLHIWLHKGNNWLLLETICLLEMLSTLGMPVHKLESDCFLQILSTLGMPGHTLESEGIAAVLIRQVGDNGQFVTLQMCKCIFYLDIKCRTLCKLYESTIDGQRVCSVHPFMMIWPPTFPALKEDPDRNAT